jgi:ribonucleoside-diphosphate reductase alpha chain
MFNPRAVEKSVWNPNGTDEVLTFCVEAGEEALTKQQVDALALLERVKLTQSNWVKYGKVDKLCVQPWLSHNVSNTINVKKHEWDSVTKFIYTNKQCFTGVALLSHEGDLDYPQAPFCAVKTEEELLEEYGKGVFLASGLIVDGLHAFGDNLWAACDAVAGNGESILQSNAPTGVSPIIIEAYEKVWKDKMNWVRRFKQFADRYMGGEIRKTSHCLKDVHNFKLWQDLTREYIDIDYKEFGGTNDTNVTADAACAGGKCQII